MFGTPASTSQAGEPLLSASKPTQSTFGAPGVSSQPQQQQTRSLFETLNTTSQFPKQQPQTGAPFASLGTQTKPENNSGLGNSTTHQQNQQPQLQQSGAYFDSLLEKSRKRTHGETALEELPSLELGLGDLRQRIKKLGPSVQDQDANGRAHYLLAASGVDPGSAIRDISYFDAHTRRTERSKPDNPPDNDVGGYLASLHTQTTLDMIADGLARSVRDFDAFLEDNVVMEWDAQRKRIYNHFGIKSRDPRDSRDGEASGGSQLNEQGGFGRSRRSKSQSLRGSRGPATSTGKAFGRSSLTRSVIGTPGPIGTGQQNPFTDVQKKIDIVGGNLGTSPDDHFQREKESRFAEKVQNLNAERLLKYSYPILQEFATVEAQNADQHAGHIVNAYNAMRIVVGEVENAQNLLDGDTVRERHFAPAYLHEGEDSATGTPIMKTILVGATRHLEQRFYQDMEALITKNPREANLGGVPDVTSKIRAYVRLRAANKDLVPENIDLQMLGDDYVWALIFFLLRSGHVKEAVEYVAGKAVAFRAIDRNFITYITSYHKSKERRLPRDLQDRINNEYNQRVRIAPENSIDPFRMACYKVIGRCEIEKRDLVGLYNSMEDWVWLQFNLAREVNRMGEIASDVYGLSEVQVTIKGIGARHFSKGGADQFGGFGVYFYLQVLAGLYEDAVKYLYTFQYVAGVHFAIALDYYGLLRVSDLSVPAGELLTHNTRGSPQINFAQMIGYYTRDFRAANAVAAADYLVLIYLNADLPGDAGVQQVSQCHEALRELVLETREFAQLLGDVRSDGQRIRGAIEERMALIGLADTNDFMRTVTIQAASIADDSGRTTDSVLLYHLAGEYDNVIAIVNRALSEAISVDIGQEALPLMPLRPRTQHGDQEKDSSLSLTTVDDPVVLAQNMLTLYTTNSLYTGIASLNRGRNTCLMLLKMQEAKVLVREEQWTRALDVLAALQILPLEAYGDSAKVRQSAGQYPALPPSVARNVPNLIIWTIRCCSKQRSILSQQQYGGNEGTRHMMADTLKGMAKDVMMYSGFLKYRLPASVNDTLARIAAE